MNEKELTKKLKENLNLCPYCKGEDLSMGDKDGLSILSIEVICHDCENSWYEHYKFVSASPSN